MAQLSSAELKIYTDDFNAEATGLETIGREQLSRLLSKQLGRDVTQNQIDQVSAAFVDPEKIPLHQYLSFILGTGCGASSENAACPVDGAEWLNQFCVLGRLASKDVPATVACLKKEGCDQVSDSNEKSPGWTVLGTSNTNAEKVSWVAYFDSEAAYFSDHKNAQNQEMNPGKRANVMEAFMKYGLHEQFPMNLAGGYMGDACHLENPKALYLHDGFAILETITADNAQGAQTVLQLAKTTTAKTMAANLESCARVTILGPGGDKDYPERDDKKMFIVHQWTSEAAFKAAGVKSTAELMESPNVKEAVCEQFTDTTQISHYKKPLIALREVPGEEGSLMPRITLLLYSNGEFYLTTHHKSKTGTISGERSGKYTREAGKEGQFAEGESIQVTFTGGAEPFQVDGFKITSLSKPNEGQIDPYGEEEE